MENTKNKKICLNNRKDITGFRFGRLVALYPTDKRDYKGTVIWKCRCDCGNEKEISYDCLVYGKYYSCGCLKKEEQQNLFKRLTFMDHTCLEWLQNRKSRIDNQSGNLGIFLRRNGTYLVSIGFKKKRYYLGTYRSYEEALNVRKEAEDMIHNGFLRAYDRWKASAGKNAGVSDFIFDVNKGHRYIEIVSSDTDENGKRLDF